MILCAGLMVCLGAGLRAQQTLPTISPFELGYSIRSWTMDDGLKGPYIGALVQARDGALLFSDSEGLIRYNGIEFKDLIEGADPGVPRRDILAIHEEADGRIWTAGLTGQAMRESGGRWVPIGRDRGGNNGVGKFARGPDGRLWCAVSSSAGLVLSVFEEGRFRPVPEKPLRTGYVQEMEFDRAGQLWLSVASQGSRPSVFRLEGESLLPEVSVNSRNGTLFRKEGDDRLWLVTRRGILAREGDSWREVIAFAQELPERSGFSACVADGDGNYWIATRSLGIWVCQPDGQASRLISEEVKFPNLIRDLFTGRDGTIWFNGENSLIQLRHRPFTVWPQPQQHRRATIHAMAEDGEGTLWFGGIGIYSLSPGEIVRSHWQDDTAVPNVYGILGKPEGGAWFATSGGTLKAVSRDAQQLVAQPPRGSGQLFDLVLQGGVPWCGLAKNLLRLRDGSLVPDLPEGVQQDGIESLATGLNGELYAGFRSKGLFCRKDAKWSFIGLDGRIGSLAVAPDNTVWASRGNGELCWFRNGQWLRANVGEMGIPSQFQMVCSREGSIWFQALMGPVIRIDRQAAESWLLGNRNVDLKLRTYGRAEGIPAEQAPYGPRKRTIIEDSRGRIWVSTVLGTCAWSPSYDARSNSQVTNKAPMPVLIEKVLVDDEQVVPTNGAVRLKPDKHRLEIHYAGLDLASPESVSYRYRIKGYQEEWVEVGNRHAAYFLRMPPGSYRFQVTAADRHGLWNEAGAILAITVLPHWWEHSLFRIGTPALLAIALSGLAYHRVRLVRRRAVQRARLQDEFSRGLIEAQESERARLAGELHDDLGQDLLVMKSRIDLARRRSESGPDPETLRQLSESTAEVLHKMRRLSHQLRPLHLDHLGLSASVSGLVKEVAEASQLECEVETDDMRGGLAQESEVAVFRILQESLNNIVKHAGARSVKVELRRHDRCATLTVHDDGCGFHLEPPQPGGRHAGHGLHAMKERCLLVGGNLSVNSAPGEGTLVRVEVPLLKEEDAVR